MGFDPPPPAHRTQAFEVCKGVLDNLDGVCLKVMQDDKGTTLLAVFGLPMHATENDAERSVSFALRVCPLLEKVPPPPLCACTALSKHGVGVEPPF